jgi:hypothetical protein
MARRDGGSIGIDVPERECLPSEEGYDQCLFLFGYFGITIIHSAIGFTKLIQNKRN